MATYTIRQTGESAFQILRDGDVVTGTGGDRSFAEKLLSEIRQQELEARTALATREPSALCALGWHRDGLPDPVSDHLGSPAFYFRFGARIGEAGGTLVFRVAKGPFLYRARTVKQLGNLKPWHCAVCGKDIPGPD